MSLFDNFNFDKLKSGLSKTRKKIVQSINETVTGKAIIDDSTIDELEEILITSDIGYDTVEQIIENVRTSLKGEKNRTQTNILNTVKQELVKVISNNKISSETFEEETKKHKPFVILIVGVNGVGKTTTIGKLAYNFRKGGAKVLVGAADTFRAAAGEQLDIWAARAGADIFQKNSGADPSSVAFESVQKAVNEEYDFVLIDTAGRLHNKVNLMNELNKIKKAISKVLPDAPHETFLILDGTLGQNALIQAEEFTKFAELSGLIITKLDGTAKGGVLFQICSRQNIPVKYIGIGEHIDDLLTFKVDDFVNAIFQND